MWALRQWMAENGQKTTNLVVCPGARPVAQIHSAVDGPFVVGSSGMNTAIREEHRIIKLEKSVKEETLKRVAKNFGQDANS